MAKGIIRNRIKDEEFRYVVERIIESGHVINGAGIAKMIGVDKGTVSRKLHELGISLNGRNRYENSTDNETRTHEEIARIIREELARIPDLRKITSDVLVERCGLNCSSQMARKIMIKYGIPWRPAGRTPK